MPANQKHILSQRREGRKDYAPGMEAFGSAVVHYKSGALGMDNPAEIKTSSL